ncbi:MAG TPA: cephalosporin hydroxylase family protein [Thermodesulfovibrionales bacterium]|nr:cephalosporin hydroxylase family protein [Thermodesulfovibrionales bacterium]
MDKAIRPLSLAWLIAANTHNYSYRFSWMGMRIIQFPQDIIAMQEIIYRMKPDLIIETGVAHGGSAVFYASMLELIGGRGEVIGIDIDIRKHNMDRIRRHPMYRRITLIQGSSTDEKIVRKVRKKAHEKHRILVCLDSSHTHEHVLKELDLYSPLVRKEGYVVVFDTSIEDMPDDFFPDRPWKSGNSPRTAVSEFMQRNRRFVIDSEIDERLLVSACYGGFLKCVKN